MSECSKPMEAALDAVGKFTGGRDFEDAVGKMKTVLGQIEEEHVSTRVECGEGK